MEHNGPQVDCEPSNRVMLLLQLLNLPPEQRAKRCREHAADAARYAAYAHEPAMKQVFARIAEQWIELADTTEVEIKTPGVPVLCD